MYLCAGMVNDGYDMDGSSESTREHRVSQSYVSVGTYGEARAAPFLVMSDVGMEVRDGRPFSNAENHFVSQKRVKSETPILSFFYFLDDRI